MRDEVLITTRLETLRKLAWPPNSTPAVAAIRIRLDEAKKEDELKAWAISWPSMNRPSRLAMLCIQAERTTIRSVLIRDPPRRPSRVSSGW